MFLLRGCTPICPLTAALPFDKTVGLQRGLVEGFPKTRAIVDILI